MHRLFLILLFINALFVQAQDAELRPSIYLQKSFSDEIRYLGLVGGIDEDVISVTDNEVIISRGYDFRQKWTFPLPGRYISEVAHSKSSFLAYSSARNIYIVDLRTGRPVDTIRNVRSSLLEFSDSEETLIVAYKNSVRFYDLQSKQFRKDTLLFSGGIVEMKKIPGSTLVIGLSHRKNEEFTRDLNLFTEYCQRGRTITGPFSHIGIDYPSQSLYVMVDENKLVVLKNKMDEGGDIDVSEPIRIPFAIERIFAIDKTWRYMVCNIRKTSYQEMMKKTSRKGIDSVEESRIINSYIFPTENCVVDLKTGKVIDTLEQDLLQFTFQPEKNILIYSHSNDSAGKTRYGVTRYDITKKSVIPTKRVNNADLELFTVSTDGKTIIAVDENWMLQTVGTVSGRISSFPLYRDSIHILNEDNFVKKTILPPRAQDSARSYLNQLRRSRLFFDTSLTKPVFLSPLSLQVVNLVANNYDVNLRFRYPVDKALLLNNKLYYAQNSALMEYSLDSKQLRIMQDSGLAENTILGYDFISDDLFLKYTYFEDKGHSHDSTWADIYSLKTFAHIYHNTVFKNMWYREYDSTTRKLIFTDFGGLYPEGYGLQRPSDSIFTIYIPGDEVQKKRGNPRSPQSTRTLFRLGGFVVYKQNNSDFKRINDSTVANISNGEIHFFRRTGQPLAAITFFTHPYEYLISTPQGFFDCSNRIVDLLYWRDSISQEFFKFEDLFNDYFVPGVLPLALQKKIDNNNYPVQYHARIPAISQLVTERKIMLNNDSGNYYLCIADPDQKTLSNIKALNLNVRETANKDCRYAIGIGKKLYDILALSKGNYTTQRRLIEYPKKGSRLIIQSFVVQTYPKGSGLVPLDYSMTAANKFSAIFLNNQKALDKNFETITLRPILLDQYATADSIVGRLNDLLDSTTENDCLVLYFIGHGMSQDNSQFYYYFPFDGMKGTEQEIFNTCLNTSLFVEFIRVLQCKRVLFILDACQSGSIAPAMKKIADYVSDFNTEHKSAYSFTSILSSLPYEFTRQDPGGSYIVTLMAQGLDLLLKQGKKVTIDEWLIEINNLAEKQKSDMKQTPLFVRSGNDFSFFE